MSHLIYDVENVRFACHFTGVPDFDRQIDFYDAIPLAGGDIDQCHMVRELMPHNVHGALLIIILLVVISVDLCSVMVIVICCPLTDISAWFFFSCDFHVLGGYNRSIPLFFCLGF